MKRGRKQNRGVRAKKENTRAKLSKRYQKGKIDRDRDPVPF
jgi:hypothetical protein